jgi:RecB family endonuclease NucS
MAPIIVSQNGRNARRIEESRFDLEDHLQEYIFSNPDVISLYELGIDTRLFVAAREFPTRSGPIDALAFDSVGNIYVVETKL